MFPKIDALTIADSAATRIIEETIADGVHALGHYMALASESPACRSALREASLSRFIFVRACQRAATANPHAIARFGDTAILYLAQLEQRFAAARWDLTEVRTLPFISFRLKGIEPVSLPRLLSCAFSSLAAVLVVSTRRCC